MAEFFTLVKIAFVTGALELIWRLVELIEPKRKGYDWHVTNVRNEHAYYCCVTQLMEYVTLPVARHLPPLYFVGDSHCLTAAWHTLTVHEQPRLLVPKLVTGLKCWHLREDSDFFPKTNFENVVKSIPDRSQCVFLFGEIDCREGIIRAVEHGNYPDLTAGCTAVVDIYIQVLLRLVDERHFTIFVQPVAPVLNETRTFVTEFNKVLREQVLRHDELHWLEGVFSGLVKPDGNFDTEFELDGTHLNPSYLRLVEAALNQLPSSVTQTPST